MINPILGVNVIIAVGSVDGMAGAAACIRHSGSSDIQLVFTQAFEVDRIDMSKWPANSKIGLIDLAVNNKGQSPNEQLTINFVKKIYGLGHMILFIADEHGKQAWENVLASCELDKSKLTIRPKDRKDYGSSCAILLKKFGASADEHTQRLLRDGHEGDQMNFDTPFGRIFNNGVKSNMMDPTRRPYIVQHMVQNETPDAKIQRWMDEYAEIEANLPKILASGNDLGDGIFLYDCSVGPHDATAIFREAYNKGNSVVVLSGTNVFVQKERQIGASIGRDKGNLNLLEILQKAEISAGGMPARVNFAMQDLKAAIDAVRRALTQ